jgi:hypothetical protein
MLPLADGMFPPKNRWYITAWSKEVTPISMDELNDCRKMGDIVTLGLMEDVARSTSIAAMIQRYEAGPDELLRRADTVAVRGGRPFEK